MASSISFLLLASSIALLFSFSAVAAETTKLAQPVKGLSYSFYQSKCPRLESIVKNYLKEQFQKDVGLAAGLLRIHFHDCFVQGCDASVLLEGSASGPSEQAAPPNLTLRPSAFKAINDLRTLIDQACGRVVSCADVVALAARDSVELSGGPTYNVPLGRRDGLSFATVNVTLRDLPSPTSNVTTLLSVFNGINLNTEDLVALSGGHTVGISHCASFTNRLYPNQDPSMDGAFAQSLKLTCPAANTSNTTSNDLRSPNKFDNLYYVDLVNRQGLFTSDQDLFSDSRTRAIVTSFAANQSLFFERFASSMIKMGQLNVLTGNRGEIRANCSVRNADRRSGLWSVVEELAETVGF